MGCGPLWGNPGGTLGAQRLRCPRTLTLQAAHVFVTVILGVRVHVIPITVHQQDGSIPLRPPHPLRLSMRKHSWQQGLRPGSHSVLAGQPPEPSHCPVRSPPLTEAALIKKHQWCLSACATKPEPQGWLSWMAVRYPLSLWVTSQLLPHPSSSSPVPASKIPPSCTSCNSFQEVLFAL